MERKRQIVKFHKNVEAPFIRSRWAKAGLLPDYEDADVEVNQEVEYDPDVALVQELSARCEALALTEDLEKIIDDRVEETVSDEEPISDEEEVENNKNHIGDEVSTTTGDEPIFCEIVDRKTDEDNDCQEHTLRTITQATDARPRMTLKQKNISEFFSKK